MTTQCLPAAITTQHSPVVIHSPAGTMTQHSWAVTTTLPSSEATHPMMAVTNATVAEILDDLAPGKSKVHDDQDWKEFLSFLSSKDDLCHGHWQRGQLPWRRGLPEILPPPAEDKRVIKPMGYHRLTSWLNNDHRRLYRHHLQCGPRIQLLLKNYGVAYERKMVKVFTPEQVQLGLQVAKTLLNGFLDSALYFSPTVANYNAMNSTLEVEDVKQEEDGIWVSYALAKQRGRGGKEHLPGSLQSG